MFSKLALAALAGVATAQQYQTEFWSERCGAGAMMKLQFFESSGTSCREGIFKPGTDWQRDEDERYFIAYTDGSGLADGCQVHLTESVAEEPDKCGKVFATITKRETQDIPCTKLKLPENLGGFWCCGDDCKELEPIKPEKRANLGMPTSFKTKTKKSDVAAVGAVKRSPILRPREECKWTGSAPYEDRDVPIMAKDDLSCSINSVENCPVELSFSHTVEQSTSYSVGAQAGASLFEIVSASVTFETTWEYSESETTTISRTWVLDPGSNGYLTWTPLRWCTEGSFTGDCDWEVETDGRVCIPKIVDGEQSGFYTFVSEF